MQQIEGTRMTMEDRKELAFQIKECENECEACPGNMGRASKLRRLRRIRDAK